jgi:hypothetical protein
MATVMVTMSISLDGFVTGPNISVEHPFELEQIRVVETPDVTHLTYRVVK